MKALILAGGKGTRLRPITFAIAKQLVPVANKPVIEYGIESIAQAGVKEFGVIVADTASEIEAVCGDGSRWGVHITYIHQPDPLGLAHAVATASGFLGDDDFIMYLGDNLIKSSISELVEEFQTHRPAATILLNPVPNPEQFGVAEMEGDRVVRLEEKPKEPRSNLALVGVYLFDRRIHDMIAELKPSGRGEYEITEAIQMLIDQNLGVRSHIVQGWWKDTGTVDAMLDANRLVLDDLPTDVQGSVDSGSTIEGRVSIGKGTTIKNSTIRGPVVIGENCTIENAYIGPYTSIDNQSIISSCEMEYSIILAQCNLQNLGDRIHGSLIGRGCTIEQSRQMPRTLRLVLGDNSEVALP